MSLEREMEVYRQFTTTQEKYDYFLMSVAGAAIAFAIHRTSGMSLNWSMVLLGIAVILWATSFLAGCRRRNYIGSNLFANFDLLRVQGGEDKVTGTNQIAIEAASQGILDAMEYNSNRALFWANIQLYSLIIGALFFVAWHVVSMIPEEIKATLP